MLALLAPYRDLPFDATELADAVGFPDRRNGHAGAGAVLHGAGRRMVGARPAGGPAIRRPFRERFRLDGVELDVRMESWLPTDTIRRAGFGQVVVGRRHALTLERGVRLVLLSVTADTPQWRVRVGTARAAAAVSRDLTPSNPGSDRLSWLFRLCYAGPRFHR